VFVKAGSGVSRLVCSPECSIVFPCSIPIRGCTGEYAESWISVGEKERSRTFRDASTNRQEGTICTYEIGQRGINTQIL